MKTSELSGALLDYWTARAEGVPAAELELRADGTLCVRNMPVVGLVMPLVLVLDYSTNWALTGPMADRHDVDTSQNNFAHLGANFKYLASYPQTEDSDCGPTRQVAICRAVVRAAFGDEVEDLEW